MTKVGVFLDKCIAFLGRAGAAIGVVSIIIMTLMITLSVFTRYELNKPLLFADEYSAYLLILIAFMGFAYTARQGAHVNVDIVTRRLKKRARESLDLVTTLLLLALISVYLWLSWPFFWRLVEGNTRAPTVYLTPLWIPTSPLLLGLGLLILELVAHIVKTFTSFLRG